MAKEITITISFDDQGEVSDVKGKDIKKQDVLDNLGGIDKLTTAVIGHKPDHSPCCIIIGGYKYCWC